jgi:hypothetical protein
MRARGMPLDLMPGTGYEEKETILHASEAALFYSDGLVKAHDPEGKMFGFPRLRALIAEHGKDRSLGNFLLEELYGPKSLGRTHCEALQITETVLFARVYSFRPIWAPYTGEIHGRSSYSYRFSESPLPRPSVQQAAADVPPSRDRLSWYP